MSNQTSLSRGGYPAGTKIYRALLNQSLTGSPVATVLTNMFGVDPVWTRDSQGLYKVSLSGAFPKSKTMIYISAWSSSFSSNVNGAYRISNDQIAVETDSDGDLVDQSFEIIVYP